MCVSEWRVPLMNVTPEMIGQAPAERTASSAPRPLSTVMIVASGKRPLQRVDRALEAGRLGGDDAEVERLDLVGVGGGVTVAGARCGR